MSKWVQHVSAIGQKWEVLEEIPGRWIVKGNEIDARKCYEFPDSEYLRCDPPEVWEACTKEVVAIGCTHMDLRTRLNKVFKLSRESNELLDGYRWAWNGDALIIERRKP